MDWLKTNFFKTELELGHCSRLPLEGPCECDLYLNCAKFVTTRDYAPRLRARREREIELVADAESHDWQREVQRHRRTQQRIEQLLAELGEPVLIAFGQDVLRPAGRTGDMVLRADSEAGHSQTAPVQRTSGSPTEAARSER